MRGGPTSRPGPTDTSAPAPSTRLNGSGDARVTYAVFIRRPAVSAPRLALDWAGDRGRAPRHPVRDRPALPRGQWVGAGEPIFYVTGSLVHLVDLETILLQKIGPACVAAYNAYTMCTDLPETAFLAMGCASLCRDRDGRDDGLCRIGRIGTAEAQVERCRIRGQRDRRDGTLFLPIARARHHASCAGRLRGIDAAGGRNVRRCISDEPMTVLWTILAANLGHHRSVPPVSGPCRRGYAVGATRYAGAALRRGTRSGANRTRVGTPCPAGGTRLPLPMPSWGNLVGPGVSAAAVWHRADALDGAGFPGVKIVASSGFDPAKCKLMGRGRGADPTLSAPEAICRVCGTKHYATADIIEYDGEKRVKIGREFCSRD